MTTTTNLDLNSTDQFWDEKTLHYWNDSMSKTDSEDKSGGSFPVLQREGSEEYATQQQPQNTGSITPLDNEMKLKSQPFDMPSSKPHNAVAGNKAVLPKYAIVFGAYDAYNPPGATNVYRKIRGRRRNIAMDKLNEEIYTKLLDEFQKNPTIYGTMVPKTPDDLLFVRKYVPPKNNDVPDPASTAEDASSELFVDVNGVTVYKKITNHDRDHAVKKDINQKRTRSSDITSNVSHAGDDDPSGGSTSNMNLRSLVYTKRQQLAEICHTLDQKQVQDYQFCLTMSDLAVKNNLQTSYIIQSLLDMMEYNWTLLVHGGNKKTKLGCTMPVCDSEPPTVLPEVVVLPPEIRKNDCPWNAWNERTCASAAADGKLNILQYAYNNGCPWDENTCAKAAEYGHLDILQWARNNGCPWDQRTCTLAAEKGHLDILQWARDNNCPWDANTCEKAAEYGHLHVLQWARTNGCEWNIRTCNEAAKNGHLHVLQWARENDCEWNASTCASAAMNGHLHVLQWAHTNGCDWDEWTCTRAAENGYLNVLQWARNSNCPWDEWTCVYAAENGHLNVLQWARANGCLWYTETCTRAAKKGHLDVLQWARVNGCEWDVWTCTFAAENGHFDVLQWARTNGCPWDEWTCTRAAENGHLDILQWARANGCPWNEWTCTRAAENGHLHILQWARMNDCPWDIMTCAFAAENGYLEVLEWAHANGCPWNELTCTYAAENGHLDVLQWARTNGCKWDARTCSRAAKYGHLEVLKWAHSNGCPWDVRTSLYAAKSGHLHILQWARDNGCPDSYGYDSMQTQTDSLSDDDEIDNQSYNL
jgi:hypothetical protein